MTYRRVKEKRTLIEHLLISLTFSAYSQQTLDYAIRLAKYHQAHVTLLHVMWTPTQAGVPPVGSGLSLLPLFSDQQADVQYALETGAERVCDVGLACETVLTRGVPSQRIAELAKQRHIDLIVMGVHRHQDLLRFCRGGLAKKVVRLAPCPVLMAPSATAATA